MRHECRKRGIRSLKVVYSTEKSIQPYYNEDGNEPEMKGSGAARRPAPGSDAFVPSAAGLIIASEVVRDLTDFDPTGRTK
jgi:tRNA A37 threonylcarbamoyladenosine dehydratase